MNIHPKFAEGGSKSDMTLRDWFAGLLMQAIAEKIILEAAAASQDPIESLRKTSKIAWALADVMIETKYQK
jgi:hypothetical protein